MRARSAVLFALIFSLCAALSAQAAATEPKRVALVIGNGAYRHAPVLENPVNDAGDVAAALKKLGFEVVEGLDLDEVGIRRTIKLFAERLTGAPSGFSSMPATACR